jgi:hypothetical protein
MTNYPTAHVAKPRDGFSLKRNRSVASRSGSVLFEFAVTLPLMMILSVAVLDLSKITFLHFLVSDAAGAASRHASMVPSYSESMDSWQQSLEDAARGSLVGSPWIDPSELIIPLASFVQISDQERSITIRVEYPYEAQFPWMGFSTHSTIAHEVTVYGAN